MLNSSGAAIQWAPVILREDSPPRQLASTGRAPPRAARAARAPGAWAAPRAPTRPAMTRREPPQVARHVVTEAAYQICLLPMFVVFVDILMMFDVHELRYHLHSIKGVTVI